VNSERKQPRAESTIVSDTISIKKRIDRTFSINKKLRKKPLFVDFPAKSGR